MTLMKLDRANKVERALITNERQLRVDGMNRVFGDSSYGRNTNLL